jgi:hypothetical protein
MVASETSLARRDKIYHCADDGRTAVFAFPLFAVRGTAAEIFQPRYIQE